MTLHATDNLCSQSATAQIKLNIALHKTAAKVHSLVPSYTRVQLHLSRQANKLHIIANLKYTYTHVLQTLFLHVKGY